MSRLVFTRILDEVLSESRVGIGLNDADREMLYQELLHYFGLIGALNVCEALDTAWQDPYNQNEIKEFITAWLRRRAREKEKAITGLI